MLVITGLGRKGQKLKDFKAGVSHIASLIPALATLTLPQRNEQQKRFLACQPTVLLFPGPRSHHQSWHAKARLWPPLGSSSWDALLAPIPTFLTLFCPSPEISRIISAYPRIFRLLISSIIVMAALGFLLNCVWNKTNSQNRGTGCGPGWASHTHLWGSSA
jgi:hypothetical protein